MIEEVKRRCRNVRYEVFTTLVLETAVRRVLTLCSLIDRRVLTLETNFLKHKVPLKRRYTLPDYTASHLRR